MVTRTRLTLHIIVCRVISYTTTAGRNTAMTVAVTPRKQFSAILRILAGWRNYADLKSSVADSCWHCMLSCQHKNRYVTETGLDGLPTCKVIMTSHIKYAYIKLWDDFSNFVPHQTWISPNSVSWICRDFTQLWRCVLEWRVPDVSEGHTVFIVMCKVRI